MKSNTDMFIYQQKYKVKNKVNYEVPPKIWKGGGGAHCALSLSLWNRIKANKFLQWIALLDMQCNRKHDRKTI